MLAAPMIKMDSSAMLGPLGKFYPMNTGCQFQQCIEARPTAKEKARLTGFSSWISSGGEGYRVQ